MQGIIGYNIQTGRYGLIEDGAWLVDGFACGECLQVLIDGAWVDTRIEQNAAGEWYLVGTGLRDDDMAYLKARIDNG